MSPLQPKNLRCFMLGICPDTTSVGIMDSSEEDLKQTNVPACRVVYPHAEVGRVDLINNGLAINCNILIKHSARPFVSWTYGNECSNYILVDSQYVLNASDLNSLAPSKRMD